VSGAGGERRGRLDPAVAAVRNAVADFADRYDVTEGSLVLVSLSGGADSLALAAAAAFVARSRGFRVGSVTVDHGLQARSSEVASNAAVAATSLGLDPVVVERVVVGSEGGPEAAARNARYAAIARVASEHGAAMTLTGHTLGDQAETVLLGLARGRGPGSLHGMPEFDGAIGRPLLGIDRETTRAATLAEGLIPWDDPHNDDERFTRVRVRNVIMPLLERELGPGIAKALARTAELIRDDDAALDLLAEGMARTALGDDVPVSFDVDAVAPKPRALRSRIIRIAARTAWGTTLSHAQTLAIDALLVDWHGQGAIDVTGGRVVRNDGRIVFDQASED
jgi:tRNA(Ile)-lysidine synthase